MRYAQLIEHCVTCLRTFDARRHTESTHLSTFLSSTSSLTSDPDLSLFVSEVFLGVQRYHPFLATTVAAFYARDRAALKSDERLYIVLAYLTLFRADELGLLSSNPSDIAKGKTKKATTITATSSVEGVGDGDRDGEGDADGGGEEGEKRSVGGVEEGERRGEDGEGDEEVACGVVEASHFVSVMRALPAPKVFGFLAFLVGHRPERERDRERDGGAGALRDAWCTVYDVAYVDDVLIPTLTRLRRALHRPLCAIDPATTASTATPASMTSSSSATTATTIARPFRLATASRAERKSADHDGRGDARDGEEEDAAANRAFRARPIPRSSTVDGGPAEAREAAEAFGRGEMRSSVRPSTKPPVRPVSPKLATDCRPSNLERVRAEVEAERSAAMQPAVAPTPIPRSNDAAAAPEVRMNTAAILREDALFRRKQEAEAELLRAYESGLRDAAAFERWQREQRARDEAERLADVEMRRAEMQMADVAAREARDTLVAERQREASADRAEAAAEAAERRSNAEAEAAEQRRAIAEAAEAQRAAIAEAEHADRARKHSSAQRAKRQRRQREMQLAEQAEQERQRKEAAVLRARAEASVRPGRAAAAAQAFDPTQTSGLGLMSEMSLCETRERLAAQRRQTSLSLSAKRQEIADARSARQSDLQRRREAVERRRSAAARATQRERERDAGHRRRVQETADKMREEGMIKLHQDIQAKRDARGKEREREREREKAQRPVAAGAGRERASERREGEVEKAAARRARERQEERERERERERQVREKDKDIRRQHTSLQATQREQTRREYDATLAERKDDAEREREREKDERRERVEKGRREREDGREANLQRSLAPGDRFQRSLRTSGADQETESEPEAGSEEVGTGGPDLSMKELEDNLPPAQYA